MTASPVDFSVARLGPAMHPSPLGLSTRPDDMLSNYVSDEQRVLHQIVVGSNQARGSLEDCGLLEKAGPRQHLFFESSRVTAAILTAGGLCPGLNDVIRSVVMTLWYRYGARKIFGLRHGYRGLAEFDEHPPLMLEPDSVRDIHQQGGTILGSSRGGGEQTAKMADELVAHRIDLLFAIGGDGTQKGALALSRELGRRNLPIAVVGIPKTIDNDLSFVERSFGFETAVAEAVRAVTAAHVEARDALRGVGLVKVMGRESGFIAAHTALARNDVNYVLLPEVPFELDGERGLFRHLAERLERRNHAVILVAEGAGQRLLEQRAGTDASGNRRLGDIGLYLKERIVEHFEQQKNPVNLKYIDPSYIIRATPANPSDAIYCARLGANAVHAAMSGRTACLVGLVNNRYVHVPMELAVGHRNHVDPESALWRDVVEATGQPPLFV